jgi:hypothetical protein
MDGWREGRCRNYTGFPSKAQKEVHQEVFTLHRRSGGSDKGEQEYSESRVICGQDIHTVQIPGSDAEDDAGG